MLGLSISLALVVGTWLRNVTEDTGKTIVRDTLQDQQCVDTLLVLSETSCSTSTVRFLNTGSFNITKVKCDAQDVYLTDTQQPLAPGEESILIYTCINVTHNISSIVPFTLFDGKEFACAGNTLSIRC